MNDLVEDYLIEKGIKVTHMGFAYLVDAIVAVINDRDKARHMTALYQEIGKYNNTSLTRVERNIRYALESADIKVTSGEFILRTAIILSKEKERQNEFCREAQQNKDFQHRNRGLGVFKSGGSVQ